MAIESEVILPKIFNLQDKSINFNQPFLEDKEWFRQWNALYPIKQKKYILRNGLIIKNRRQFIKSTYKTDKVLAYDTETHKGICKLICRNEGKIRFIENPTFKQALDFLFYLAHKNSTKRFYFNIDFDISSIIKLWNNFEEIKKLTKGIEVFYKDYALKWIVGRFFSIKNIKGKRAITFTDLNAFFHLGLNEASQKYLNKFKNKDIDGNKLNNDLTYWKENREKIIDYCIKDCELTQELAWVLIDTIKKNDTLEPKHLISPASLSKQQFRFNCYIPNISQVPKKILQISYDCYYGGRFEMFKRGTFKSLYLYDIVSQYPSYIRDLPNLRNGLWIKTKIIPKNKCLGFFLVKVNIPNDYRIPTIPFRDISVNVFPNGCFTKWMTWFDIDLIREYVVKVFNGYVFEKSPSNYKPFRDEIDSLFDKKCRCKGKSKLQYNINKLTMNAFYGCLIESHEIINDKGLKELHAGIMFNPVYASLITAFGRWSVIKDIPKDKYKHIIAIHTDSIISDIDLSEYLDIGKKLGQWEIVKQGNGIIFNTGMYQISDLVKTRGIPKKFIVDWYDFCKLHKEELKVEFKIPHMKKIREAIIQDKNLVKVNTIQNLKRSVFCNSDHKRDWINQFNSFNDVLTTNHDSLPFIKETSFSKLDCNPICIVERCSMSEIKNISYIYKNKKYIKIYNKIKKEYELLK